MKKEKVYNSTYDIMINNLFQTTGMSCSISTLIPSCLEYPHVKLIACICLNSITPKVLYSSISILLCGGMDIKAVHSAVTVII